MTLTGCSIRVDFGQGRAKLHPKGPGGPEVQRTKNWTFEELGEKGQTGRASTTKSTDPWTANRIRDINASYHSVRLDGSWSMVACGGAMRSGVVRSDTKSTMPLQYGK